MTMALIPFLMMLQNIYQHKIIEIAIKSNIFEHHNWVCHNIKLL